MWMLEKLIHRIIKLQGSTLPRPITVANNRLVGILLQQKVPVVTVSGWGVNPPSVQANNQSLLRENIRECTTSAEKSHTGRFVPQILLCSNFVTFKHVQEVVS